MIYQPLYRQHRGKRLSVGVIGPGHFGTAIICQSIESEILKIPIAADRSVERARLAFKRAGVSDDAVVACDSASQAQGEIERGKYVVVQDPMILMQLPLDVIVESTGVAAAGAHHAVEAIRHGKHVAIVSKETDATVGPLLQRMAKKQNLTYTQVDGDHPGLLIGLIHWARSLGLQIVSAGKARDVELVLDRKSKVVTCEADGITVMETHTQQLCDSDLKLFDELEYGSIPQRIRARRDILSTMPAAEGYDLCEVLIAANACGLAPDTGSLHNPILRTSDIPKVLCPLEEGGILATSGAVEVIDCFRDRFESGLGGAVFVVVSCENDYSRMILTTKGLVTNRSGKSSLIYRPYHLCGVETSTSILCAGLANISTGSDVEEYVQRYDIVRTSSRDLKAGYVFGDDHDHNLKTKLLPAGRMAPDAPAPAHLLHHQKLLVDVPAGTLITYGMVEKPADSVLWTLRAEQDELFSG
jgi:predicted homoserine dehydrogenase-like protein